MEFLTIATQSINAVDTIMQRAELRPLVLHDVDAPVLLALLDEADAAGGALDDAGLDDEMDVRTPLQNLATNEIRQ
jgi:hypothetical protein